MVRVVRAPVAVFVLAFASGCAGQGAPTTVPTSSLALVAPTVTPTATPEITPEITPGAPALAVPVELQGRWRAQLAGDVEAILELTGSTYRINGAGGGNGRAEVHGDEIDFSHGSLCDGIGRYRWSLTGSTLHFAPIERDECAFRADSFRDTDYVKAA